MSFYQILCTPYVIFYLCLAKWARLCRVTWVICTPYFKYICFCREDLLSKHASAIMLQVPSRSTDSSAQPHFCWILSILKDKLEDKCNCFASTYSGYGQYFNNALNTVFLSCPQMSLLVLFFLVLCQLGHGDPTQTQPVRI